MIVADDGSRDDTARRRRGGRRPRPAAAAARQGAGADPRRARGGPRPAAALRRRPDRRPRRAARRRGRPRGRRLRRAAGRGVRDRQAHRPRAAPPEHRAGAARAALRPAGAVAHRASCDLPGRRRLRVRGAHDPRRGRCRAQRRRDRAPARPPGDRPRPSRIRAPRPPAPRRRAGVRAAGCEPPWTAPAEGGLGRRRPRPAGRAGRGDRSRRRPLLGTGARDRRAPPRGGHHRRPQARRDPALRPPRHPARSRARCSLPWQPTR